MPEIPFPQAPQARISNPLEGASQMQGLALRGIEAQRTQQSMEQQQQLLGAKQAMGQVLQQHFNPETGELDDHAFITDLATHPEAGLIMGDAYKMLLDAGKIKAETAVQQLDAKAKKLDIKSGLAASVYEKAIRENAQNTPESNMQFMSDYFGHQVAAGLMTSEEATKLLPQLGKAVKQGLNAKDILRSEMMASKSGIEAARANKLLLSDMTAPVKVFDQQTGMEREVPAYQVKDALLPAFQEQATAGFRNASQGGVAPPAEGEARQGLQPSGAPAAPQEPQMYERTTSASPELGQYLAYQKGEGWLRKEQESAATNLESAYKLESELKTQEKLLQQFAQGPGEETRVKIAEALTAIGAPQGIIDTVIAAKGKGDAVAAAQAARKYIYGNSMTALKNALGPGQRFTNFELQTAQKSNYGLDTAKPAINVLMNDMHRIIQIAKEEAEGLQHYTDKSLDDPRNRKSFNQIHYQTTIEKWLKHKGLLREGPFDVSQEPGE